MCVPDNVSESLSDRTGSGIKSSCEENAGTEKACVCEEKKDFICFHGWTKIFLKGKKNSLCQLS